MEFYKLTHPVYANPDEETAHNPLSVMPDYWMPGITCSRCNESWQGNRRLYLGGDNELVRSKLRNNGYLSDKAWYQLRDWVRKELSINETLELRPGDQLGRLILQIDNFPVPDFLHPFPGQVIVLKRVIEILEKSGITGYRTQRAEVIPASGLHVNPYQLPVLFEILPTGNAWRFGADAKENQICQLCDRRQFLKLSRWNIDPQRWDGSDFFNLEMNPNMIFVTQRVKDLFDGQNLSNYVCLPLSVQEEATVRLMKIRNGSLK